MFLFLAIREKGLRKCMDEWKENFIRNKEFRVVFIWIFYVAMVMCRTLLNRNMWLNPLEDIRGVWSLYDAEGHLYTENIENLMLFIPLAFLSLLLISVKKRIEIKFSLKILATIAGGAFGVSFGIEFIQLLLRCGTFQLSDLVFNTIGGVVGGVLFCIVNARIKKRKDSQGRLGEQ